MKTDPKLHHAAKRIMPGSLENVIELFGILGCKLAYQPSGMRWAMIAQDGLEFDVQLVESRGIPLEGESRRDSQVSFISENPIEHIEKVRAWAEKKGLKFYQNSWSDREFYFDLPELFVDWVVEVMHVSILED